MINEVNVRRENSINLNKKFSANRNVSFGNEQCDRVDIHSVSNEKKNIAKKSIIAGIAMSLASLGFAVIKKKARANILPHEYIEIPLLVGTATTLFTNFIGNYFNSRKTK